MSAQEDKKLEIEKYIEQLYRDVNDGKISRNVFNDIIKIFNDNIDVLSFIKNVKYDDKNSSLYADENIKKAVDGIEKTMIGYVGTVISNSKEEIEDNENKNNYDDNQLKERKKERQAKVDAYKEYFDSTNKAFASLEKGLKKSECVNSISNASKNVHYLVDEEHLGRKKAYNAVVKVFKNLPSILNRQEENIRKGKTVYATIRLVGYTLGALYLANKLAPIFGLLILGDVFTVTRLVVAVRRKEKRYPLNYDLEVGGNVFENVKKLDIEALKTFVKIGIKGKNISRTLKIDSIDINKLTFANDEKEDNKKVNDKSNIMSKIAEMYTKDEYAKINEFLNDGVINLDVLEKMTKNVAYGRNLLETYSKKAKKEEKVPEIKGTPEVKDAPEAKDTPVNNDVKTDGNDAGVKSEIAEDKPSKAASETSKPEMVKSDVTSNVEDDNKKEDTKTNITNVDNSIIYDLATLTDRAYRSYKNDKSKLSDKSFEKGVKVEELYDSLSFEQTSIFESMEKISKIYKEVRKYNDKFRENKYITTVLEIRDLLDDFRIDFNNNVLAKKILTKISLLDEEDLKRAFDNELNGYYDDIKNVEVVVKINEKYAAGLEKAKKRKQDLVIITELLTKYFSARNATIKQDYENQIIDKINTLDPVDAQILKDKFGSKMDKFIK